MMIKKFGVEYPISISGVESDTETSGLWQFDWPAHHQEMGETKSIKPIQVSRSWVRVIPKDFPNGGPPISTFYDIPENVKLRPPGPPKDFGDNRNGARGPCEFGYIAYNISNEDNDIRSAYDLSGFLEKTGEVWVSIGNISHNNNGKEIIYSTQLLTYWKWGLINAINCLDALGASKQRRIIIGIEGLMDLFWYRESPFTDSPARKSKIIHDVAETEWSIQDHKDFLTNAWNKLLNAFNLSPFEPPMQVPITPQQFQS